MSDEPLCEETVHVWEGEEGEVTPPSRRCQCGEFTWADMDDILMLCEMWERS